MPLTKEQEATIQRHRKEFHQLLLEDQSKAKSSKATKAKSSTMPTAKRLKRDTVATQRDMVATHFSRKTKSTKLGSQVWWESDRYPGRKFTKKSEVVDLTRTEMNLHTHS
uniref:Uncharacterized protein n=1 Tax=Florenciella parvula TaxID=236787 RepID=A0A7S2BTE0_9STRA|mmetsp:Transcript_20243/g.42670  ORF Transcript_20243/g.42670 Transcript_20243/m.42670 type:complete len:110 (+) Transcript_20243:121-450(+)